MRIRIILKSFNKELINNAIQTFSATLLKENQSHLVQAVISLPIKIKKFCVLRSPHIDKNSREHFELRIYKKFIDIELESLNLLQILLNLQLDAGIACNIKTFN